MKPEFSLMQVTLADRTVCQAVRILKKTVTIYINDAQVKYRLDSGLPVIPSLNQVGIEEKSLTQLRELSKGDYSKRTRKKGRAEEDYRYIVQARLQRNISILKIAQHLGVNSSTIYKTIHRHGDSERLGINKEKSTV
jgi:DNA-binding NtrC family response regulator